MPGKKVCIVGAGWAGFGAAKHLSEQGAALTTPGPPHTCTCAVRCADCCSSDISEQHLDQDVRRRAGYDVTLLDAAAHPGGLAAGWKTKQGKTVDAGMKGFWYEVRVPCSCKHSVKANTVACMVLVPAYTAVGNCTRSHTHAHTRSTHGARCAVP